jgi:hypothetical protein
MTKLKKCLLMMAFGAGLGLSVNAFALPGCDACNDFYLDCQAGDAAMCTHFVNMRCYYYNTMDCAVFN